MKAALKGFGVVCLVILAGCVWLLLVGLVKEALIGIGVEHAPLSGAFVFTTVVTFIGAFIAAHYA